MKTTVITRKLTVTTSSVLPDVSATDDPELAAVIEWADANPVVWKIVTAGQTRSAFGKHGIDYLGCERGDSPAAVASRVVRFQHFLQQSSNDFFRWRAEFAVKHFGEKGYTSGFFQQFDGAYPRGCMHLDYTPARLEAVLDRFLAWCGTTYSTKEVWLTPPGKRSDTHHRVVRRFP